MVYRLAPKEDRQKRLRGKPQNVLGAVVGYEGKGSLASYLKNAGLVSSIFAGVVSDTSDLETFALAVEFTPGRIYQTAAQ